MNTFIKPAGRKNSTKILKKAKKKLNALNVILGYELRLQ